MIFRHACPLNSLSHNVIVFWFDSAKVRKVERNTKGKLAFIFISETEYLRRSQR